MMRYIYNSQVALSCGEMGADSRKKEVEFGKNLSMSESMHGFI